MKQAVQKVRIEIINPGLINRFGRFIETNLNSAREMVNNGVARYPLATFINQNAEKKPEKHIKLACKPDIVWVQDDRKIGGAELSNKTLIEFGKKSGFDIALLTPNSFDTNMLNSAKLLILNNLFHFNTVQMIELKKVVFERGIPFVKYEHDYREIDNPERKAFARRLFSNAALSVFISPRHKEIHKKNVYIKNIVCLPLAIDTKIFRLLPEIKRDENKIVCTSGDMIGDRSEFNFEFIKDNPQFSYDLYTVQNKELITKFSEFKNVKLFPVLNNEELPKVYNSAGKLLHLTKNKGAGDRVLFEAALCGCEIITNKNAGHTSWKYDYNDTESLKKQLDNAISTFWKRIDALL